MEIQCCKCAKVRHDNEWQWPEGFTDGPVSYSYCPECLDEFRCENARRRSSLEDVIPRLFAAAYA